ncbi:MAG: hypothetical protein AB1814_00195 [Thermodesulfobacteriota bacterium]
MALDNPKRPDLTLEISGSLLSPERFIRGANAFFNIVKDIAGYICASQVKIKWNVWVGEGSRLIGALPINTAPAVFDKIKNMVHQGSQLLEEKADFPPGFSETTIRHYNRLATLAATDDEDDTIVKIWIDQKPSNITHRTVANTAELLKAIYEDYGSVEGRLQVVSERGGLQFKIYEPIHDNAIKCFIDNDMLSQAINSFGKRVEVYGLIRYRADGVEVSVKVEDIIVFPPPEQLPSAQSVRGLLGERLEP